MRTSGAKHTISAHTPPPSNGNQVRTAMKSHTMLVVRDVEASSTWYQAVFGLKSGHGGPDFEMLMSDGQICLLLHHDRPGLHWS